jgi:hypothetical protein
MHNQTESTHLHSRKASHEGSRTQPVVVMATLGAQDVDANGAPCEPASSDARARVASRV